VRDLSIDSGEHLRGQRPLSGYFEHLAALRTEIEAMPDLSQLIEQAFYPPVTGAR
jgi:hypothetical protein